MTMPNVVSDDTSAAVLAELRHAYRRRELWLARSEIVAASGLSDGQVHAALLALADRRQVERGLFDDGSKLLASWRVARDPEAGLAAEAAE
jgi:hypothetical protein